MKKIIKFFAIATVMVAFSAATYAQDTNVASATASATIITPLTIHKDVDMNFGNLALILASSTGTLVLDPDGSRTPDANVSLPTPTGSPAAASFTVNGSDASTYTITLPTTDYTITRLTGSETMTVNTFTSTPSGTGALTSGTQTLTVGATLHVSANQVAGTYTNATGFNVTVNYN